MGQNESIRRQAAILYYVNQGTAAQKELYQTLGVKKIHLTFLPPYSPNLNLIERLWKFLRKTVLVNQYYHSFQEFYAAIERFI